MTFALPHCLRLPAIVLASCLLWILPARVRAADPVPQTLQQSLLKIGSADDAGRQAIYNEISTEGDARLIPVLNAYRDGKLQNRDGHLIIYGDSVQLPGKGNAFPVLDAFTLQQLTGADGQPEFLVRKTIDLSAPGMMRLPPAKRAERGVIAELISSLSLLDPDPEKRIQSIREAAERVTRAFVDPGEEARFAADLSSCAAALKPAASDASSAQGPQLHEAISAMDAAAAQKPAKLTDPAPDEAATARVISALTKLKAAYPSPPPFAGALDQCLGGAQAYRSRLINEAKSLDELPKYRVALKKQLEKDGGGKFGPALREAVASLDLVLGDHDTQLMAARTLGKIGTGRAANLLEKVAAAAHRCGETDLAAAADSALASANRYQAEIHFVQNTFAGLSLGSILVLLALGLSIIFGLMGVINMAQGEFMMVGAFTTYLVSEGFKHLPAGAYDYYIIAAVPAAFLVAGGIGYLCENLIIRYLYGRPLDTLLATWGIGLVLIQVARQLFGDTLSVTPPHWMEGGIEVAPDLTFPLNRVCIIIYCVICIAAVHLIVNRTKLGLLLRATTQNRSMAGALGVATRRVDGLTFAFGAGLAGLAGVVVPLYNKINPSIGQEYIVDCFMVVVVGGVGKLAGAIWAGLGLGFLSKYLEPVFESVPALASGASVIGKVVVLGLIIVFLQWRPSGLFPPKGRMADA